MKQFDLAKPFEVRFSKAKAKIELSNLFIAGIWLVGTIGRETGPIKPHLIACYVAVPFFITGVVNYSAVTFVGKTQLLNCANLLVKQLVGSSVSFIWQISCVSWRANPHVGESRDKDRKKVGTEVAIALLT